MNLNIKCCFIGTSYLTCSSTTTGQNPHHRKKIRNATVFHLDTLLLNARNSSAPWKHFVWRISFEGMQDHRYLCLQSAYQTWSNTLWLSFLLAKSSSNLCRHKLIRSAEICKQRTVSNTLVCNPPTWNAAAQVKYQTNTFHLSPSLSASNGLLAYLVQHLNYNWGQQVGTLRA